MSLTKVSYSMIQGASANVADFGATGDGTTNDTVAIQSALDSGAAFVYFPKGTYAVSYLTVNNNQKLFGTGIQSIILATNATADAPAGIISANNKSGIEICDLKLQGINRPQNNISTNQDGDRGISFDTCSDINIHDCEVSGFWSFGIVCSGGSNIRINNNYVNNIGNQSCIAVSNQVIQATVSNNICQNGKLYGVEAENFSSNLTIVGNVIDNCVAGIALVRGISHTAVTGNKIRNCNNTNTISGSSGIGLYYVGSSTEVLYDISTTGNVVSDNNAYALNINGGHQNLTFAGNTFQNSNTNTTNKLVEIVAGTGTKQNVVFTGNIFECFNVSNAFIADGIFNYTFTGNDVMNANGNVFTFLNSCTNNNFEIPKVSTTQIANIPNQESLPSDLTNWFWSADKSEQYVVVNGSGNFERNVKSLRTEKIIGVYWCAYSNASTGNWELKINGSTVSSPVAAVANQEVWTYTPTNIISTAGTSNLVAMSNSVSNTNGTYFKFRLVVI